MRAQHAARALDSTVDAALEMVTITTIAFVVYVVFCLITIDEHERTALVATRLFAVVRHPIYAAVSVFLFGLVLAVPNAFAVAGVLAWVAGIEVRVRAVEEPTLLRLHGDRYKSYAERVGRFAPGVGRC